MVSSGTMMASSREMTNKGFAPPSMKHRDGIAHIIANLLGKVGADAGHAISLAGGAFSAGVTRDPRRLMTPVATPIQRLIWALDALSPWFTWQETAWPDVAASPSGLSVIGPVEFHTVSRRLDDVCFAGAGNAVCRTHYAADAIRRSEEIHYFIPMLGPCVPLSASRLATAVAVGTETWHQTACKITIKPTGLDEACEPQHIAMAVLNILKRHGQYAARTATDHLALAEDIDRYASGLRRAAMWLSLADRCTLTALSLASLRGLQNHDKHLLEISGVVADLARTYCHAFDAFGISAGERLAETLRVVSAHHARLAVLIS